METPVHFKTVNKLLSDLAMVRGVIERELVDSPRVRRLCPELQPIGLQVVAELNKIADLLMREGRA